MTMACEGEDASVGSGFGLVSMDDAIEMPRQAPRTEGPRSITLPLRDGAAVAAATTATAVAAAPAAEAVAAVAAVASGSSCGGGFC